MASAAAIATGLPPKVDACEPGTQSMISARDIITPSGMPEAMPLARADNVGLNAGVLDRPPLSSAAYARLHFIRDQQNAVPIANLAQLLHEDRRSHNITAFALDRLDEDRRHFLRRKRRLKHSVFDKARALESKRLRVLWRNAGTIQIGIAHVRHAGN